MNNKPNIAIAHEFLTQFGGAEKTLEAIAELFPESPIYTAKLNRNILPDTLKNRNIICPKNNFVNKASKYLFTFMMAPVFEDLDFSKYDIIVSDGTTWNKGIITKPEQMHITYIHTPPRFLYKYSTESNKRNRWYLKVFFSYLDNILRLWDYTAAQRPDYLVTNSTETRKRIFKFYRRDATVIYPPVDTETFSTVKNDNLEKPYYVALGRLVRYKNFEPLIEAFNLLDIPLIIIGSGSYEKQLKKLAKSNITFKGRVNDEEKHSILNNALGLINLVEDEDFGIVPIEAMSHGLPVLAHKSGGHLETVQEGFNGMFVEELDLDKLVHKIKNFDKAVREDLFDREAIKNSVNKYSKKRFQDEFYKFVMDKWEIYSK
jgi:glycosyltransferase involved in cell wall biosynthesis